MLNKMQSTMEFSRIDDVGKALTTVEISGLPEEQRSLRLEGLIRIFREQYSRLRDLAVEEAASIIKTYSSRVKYALSRDPGMYTGILDRLLKKEKVQRVLGIIERHAYLAQTVNELRDIFVSITKANGRKSEMKEDVFSTLQSLREKYVDWLRDGSDQTTHKFTHELYLFRQYAKVVLPAAGVVQEIRAIYRQIIGKNVACNGASWLSGINIPTNANLTSMSQLEINSLRNRTTWCCPSLPVEFKIKICILKLLNEHVPASAENIPCGSQQGCVNN
jgi:hypothetical protein